MIGSILTNLEKISITNNGYILNTQPPPHDNTKNVTVDNNTNSTIDLSIDSDNNNIPLDNKNTQQKNNLDFTILDYGSIYSILSFIPFIINDFFIFKTFYLNKKNVLYFFGKKYNFIFLIFPNLILHINQISYLEYFLFKICKFCNPFFYCESFTIFVNNNFSFYLKNYKKFNFKILQNFEMYCDKLNLNLEKILPKRCLKNLVVNCQTLQSLQNSLQYESQEFSQNLSQSFNNLKSVTIFSKTFLEILPLLENLKSINNVTIKLKYPIITQTLQSLQNQLTTNKFFTQNENLKLNLFFNCTQILKEFKKCENCKVLSIPNCHITKDFNWKNKFPNLEEIYLHICNYEVFTNLSKNLGLQLKKLNLNIDLEFFLNFNFKKEFLNFPNLVELHISNINLEFSESLQNLQNLSVFSCDTMIKENLILENLFKIKKLNFLEIEIVNLFNFVKIYKKFRVDNNVDKFVTINLTCYMHYNENDENYNEYVWDNYCDHLCQNCCKNFYTCQPVDNTLQKSDNNNCDIKTCDCNCHKNNTIDISINRLVLTFEENRKIKNLEILQQIKNINEIYFKYGTITLTKFIKLLNLAKHKIYFYKLNIYHLLQQVNQPITLQNTLQNEDCKIYLKDCKWKELPNIEDFNNRNDHFLFTSIFSNNNYLLREEEIFYWLFKEIKNIVIDPLPIKFSNVLMMDNEMLLNYTSNNCCLQ
ncbi:hypothetical protein ABK040_007328 [Willaertia magna]